MKAGKSAIKFEIVTHAPAALSSEILRKLGHGVTLLDGRGMYSGKETNILLCVVNKTQAAAVCSIVHRYPHTFAIVDPVSEILGNFKHLNSSGKEVPEVLDAGDRKTL